MKQRILFLTPYDFRTPQSGGEVRIHALHAFLRTRHSLITVTRGTTNRIREEADWVFNRKGALNQIFRWDLFRLLKKKIDAEPVDLIIANTIWTGLMAVLLGKATGTRTLFDDHNVEFLRFLRTRHPAFVFLYVLELLVCLGARRIHFVSDTDARTAQRYLFVARRKIQVVPNGFHAPAAPPRRMDFRREFHLDIERQKKVLFFGNLDYRPNREALRILQRDIVPRFETEDVAFLVAGRSRKPFVSTQKHLTFLSFVPDLNSLIHSVDLIIVPLVSGSGTRFKILEALGLHATVISNELGAEGIDRSVCGEKLIVTPGRDWRAFSEAIRQHLHDGPAKTPADFFEKYEWQKVLGRLAI